MGYAPCCRACAAELLRRSADCLLGRVLAYGALEVITPEPGLADGANRGSAGSVGWTPGSGLFTLPGTPARGADRLSKVLNEARINEHHKAVALSHPANMPLNPTRFPWAKSQDPVEHASNGRPTPLSAELPSLCDV